MQDELVSRVERAGGKVLALDVGQVTNGTAGQWLSGTMLGAVSEYQRRTAAERSGEAQARAVARGVPPWPNVSPGYLRGNDGRYEPNPATAPVVDEAFRMRDDGATVAEVRDYLREHGIERSYHGVGALLRSRVVLGEIHFGKLSNLEAHEPIVDRDLWKRVQRVRVPRGRRAKSERLLARLGILRCATCGARMVVGTSNHSGYWVYRCPPNGDCERRVTISADIAEEAVVAAVRGALSDLEGRASAQTNVREASAALERAQADLDSAIRALEGFEDESSARERLLELRHARDGAQARLDLLGGLGATVTINTVADWDRLTTADRRDLIRATVDRVTVAPGRGPARVAVKLLGE